MQSFNGDGKWNNIETVFNINDADYIIIFDGGVANLSKYSANINPNKIIYVQTEPVTHIKQHPAKFHASFDRFHYIGKWHIDLPFKYFENLSVPSKHKTLSAIISNKNFNINYNRRIEICKRLKNMLGNAFDHFGRGFNPIDSPAGKYDGLIDHKYSLCIENSAIQNYFTEKICDAFLCWTKPIYWGCPNISDYFPKESYIHIDIHNKNVINTILDEIRKPIDYNVLKIARNSVLYNYGVYASIEKIINTIHEEQIK